MEKRIRVASGVRSEEKIGVGARSKKRIRATSGVWLEEKISMEMHAEEPS